ncbi:D-hexose-6-phosphate mutarotase [Luteococcus sp. OSA5]|uniref:D-hexose-6-phosphate mutarotase n=1 Tax=Luteococcus sp. OSA5 TaxID=3401630 RepID=UPI003B438C2A
MSTENSIELPEGITTVTQNGLTAYRVQTSLGSGLVYEHGAHVAEWQPAGQDPVLWMSDSSDYADDKPLRGGIPICFPWFGPGRDGQHEPGHGFARLADWKLVQAEVSESGQAHLALELTGDQVADLAGFPSDFTARLDVAMGTILGLEFTVTAGGQQLDYEAALHTYFDVADIEQTMVEGLDGARYLDKVGGGEAQQEGAVNFTMETDRVYFSDSTTRIVDAARGRTLVVEKSNSANTVVWNPWVDKAARMPDFGDREWPAMCCVETVNALDNAVFLQPGESHTMGTAISIA